MAFPTSAEDRTLFSTNGVAESLRVRRPGQWHTANSAIFNGNGRALKDLTFSKTWTWSCADLGAHRPVGEECCWSVVPGAGMCGGRAPPPKKKDFGHSGIFLNNTSPDPDASLPNPALQRLFDLRVFSSRANENAPANMEVLPSGLASSQHAHLFLLLLRLLLLFVVTELPLPPPTSTSLKVPKSRYSACCSASRRLPWLVSHVSSRSAFSWMAMLDPQPIPLLI